MTEGTGRTALVTGASAGIGRAFAHALAARGYDVILTARRQERLDAVARELTERHRVHAHVVVEDLAQPSAPARLAEVLAARGLAVDVLVNNAGFGIPGSYANTTWGEQRDFLQVMVVAVSELTHRLLPGMLARKWGRIVNVASLAGLLPGVAGHTLYAASKAYVILFSESLALETAAHGINVTASCPGFTLSEFHDVSGTREQVKTLPAFMWMDAEQVAKESIDAVMTGVRVYIPGSANRTLARLGRVLPRSVVTALIMRNASKFRRV
jgi:uncharacterized protein